MSLARRRKSSSASVVQLDIDTLPRTLWKLGARCQVCQVPERAFWSQKDFSAHCDGCEGLGRLKDCLAGISCSNVTAGHYREFNHTDLARCLTKIPELLKQSPSFDFTCSTPKREDLPTPLKMDEDFVTPAVSATSSPKKRKMEKELDQEPMFRKNGEFRSPATGELNKESTMKEFPLGPVQNISRLFDSPEKAFEESHSGVEVPEAIPEVSFDGDKENLSRSVAESDVFYEVFDLVLEEKIDEESADEEAAELSDLMVENGYEEEEDAELFQRVDTPIEEERRIPDHKILRGTKIAVNCFDFGDDRREIGYYFLTSFHPDHYRGLRGSWSKVIYCSKLTRDLVIQECHVAKDRVRALAMNEPQIFRRGEFRVIMVDANHSPGAVMFLFQFEDGRTFVHTGSFRAEEAMEAYKEQWGIVAVDYLYLDTKYSMRNFPPRDDVVAEIVQLSAKELEKDDKTFFVCGSNVGHFGEEKVWMALADELKLKVWLDERDRKLVRLLNSEHNKIEDKLGNAMEECQVHVLPMESVTLEDLKSYFKSFKSSNFSRVVAILPNESTSSETNGESLVERLVSDDDNITIHVVPYSNHSCCDELREVVEFLRPKNIIPISGNEEERLKSEEIVANWVQSGKKDDSNQLS